MKKWPIIGITLLTLGSGLLNLYSALGHGGRERIETLRRIFPVEFIHVSHSLALLIGFALVISSFSIYKRKRRAFWFVAVMSAASAIAHLTSGLQYEQASMSAGLFTALIVQRRNFTVRSRDLNWGSAAAKTCAGFLLALSYGVIGFWLLDQRHFGVDFHWRQAVQHTLQVLTSSGGDGLIPRTHYAQRFLESLHLLTYAALMCGVWMIYRPVMYRVRIRRQEIQKARQILDRHGASSIDFFKVRPDKSLFFSSTGEAFLSFAVGRSFALVLGDPVGPREEIQRIISEFADYCRANDWRFGFYETLPDFLDLYEALGLKKLHLGEDAIVDLDRFALEEPSHKALRSKVAQLERSGVYSRYYEPPLESDLLDQLRWVSDEWLTIPGRRERQFTLGSFDRDYVRSTPVFAVHDGEGRVLAFANIIPSWPKGEATIDLMRRRTEAPNGVMDYLFAKLFLLQKQAGYRQFNLGMAPMAGFHAGEHASAEERAIHAFFQHLGFLFSFKGLFAFKAKFATRWEPRYVIYCSILELPQLGLALRRVSEKRDGGERCRDRCDLPSQQFVLQR
jgi:phosphatidylglycerol lysyltransferase